MKITVAGPVRARAALAAAAGARAKKTPPMTSRRRVDVYLRQNGGRELTARQRRQVGRMALRGLYRTARTEGAA
jgi:hypothetical protein